MDIALTPHLLTALRAMIEREGLPVAAARLGFQVDTIGRAAAGAKVRRTTARLLAVLLAPGANDARANPEPQHAA